MKTFFWPIESLKPVLCILEAKPRSYRNCKAATHNLAAEFTQSSVMFFNCDIDTFTIF